MGSVTRVWCGGRGRVGKGRLVKRGVEWDMGGINEK